MKYLLLIFIFTGCYNQRKAASDFSRAVAFDQKIATDYCATTFPVKDSIVRDTTTTTDTLYFPPEFVTDTVIEHDTVKITNTITIPGKVITNVVRITDTIYQESTQSQAKLRSCEIDKSRLIESISPITKDRDKFRKRSNTYLWIMIALGAILGVGIYTKIAGIFGPKKILP